MGELYDEFERFAIASGGFAKYTGDGMVVFKELANGHNCGMMLEFMRESYSFAATIQKMMHSRWPARSVTGVSTAPIGFRLRMVAGYVHKKFLMKPMPGAAHRSAEYFGYPVNLAQRLLSVQPEELCICHDSVVQILGKAKKGLVLSQVQEPKEHPAGIDAEDLQGLWSFRFERRAPPRSNKKEV